MSPTSRAARASVKQRVLAVADRLLQGQLANVVVQRGARHAQKQRERRLVLDHVAQGLAQAAIRFDLLARQLLVHTDMESQHQGRAVAAMIVEALHGRHVALFAEGVVAVQLGQTVDHVLAWGGEVLGHFDEFPASVRDAMSEYGLEVPLHVRRQGVAHLDGRRQRLGPVRQHARQVAAGMLGAGEEQHRLVGAQQRDDARGADR